MSSHSAYLLNFPGIASDPIPLWTGYVRLFGDRLVIACLHRYHPLNELESGTEW